MAQQLFNTLVLGSIYVLFSLGMSIGWGVLGNLNLAQGAIVMFSSYIASIVGKNHNFPFVVVLVIGSLVGGVVSVLMESVVFRAIRRSGGDEEELELRVVIASIAVASVIVALVSDYTANNTFFLQSNYLTSSYHVLGIRMTTLQLTIVGAGLILSGALDLWMRRSKAGLAVRAVAIDPETASLMAINERRLAQMTMFLAGALAGVAGIFLIAYYGGTTAQNSSALLVDAFAIIIIGGVGSIGGAVVGAVLFALLETLLTAYTSGTWAPAVSFAFIIVVILVRPQGLFASSRRKVDRV
jgi:branched-chain amino acid transport system permease protein